MASSQARRQGAQGARRAAQQRTPRTSTATPSPRLRSVPVTNRRSHPSALLATPASPQLRITGELNDRQKRDRDAIVRSLVVMLISSTVLVILGVIMVFSATSATSINAVAVYGPDVELFSVAIKQAISVGIGLALGLMMAVIPYTWVERLSWWILALGLGLQAAVLLVGTSVNGNKNWLNLGPMQIQPSEFLKLAMIVWLAHTLARLQLKEIHSELTLVLPGLGFVAASALVVAGGDMGTGIIYVLIGGGMFWIAGIRNRVLFILGFLASFFAVAMIARAPSRILRVRDFISNLFSTPDAIDPTQSEFAQYAFGSGGVTGVGLGAGREKWRDLAEAHTDFIFAVIGEELGLFGAVTVIVLFLALGWSFVHMIAHLRSRYARLVVIGVALWLCGQALINMCVVTGLLPVFGVPLPFLSQGGSSMMASLLALGVVFACGLGAPGVREALTIRGSLARRARSVMRRG